MALVEGWGRKIFKECPPGVYSIPSRSIYVQECDVCPDPAALRGAGPEQNHVIPQ